MNIESWMHDATKLLSQADISTARLDCLVLLEDCLSVGRAQLLAHTEQKLTDSQINLLNSQIEHRAQHEPLAYIRGHTEFYGREFTVDHHVLEPRPESETIIELLKGLELPAKPRIVDVGTGSGMLAITAKLELQRAEVTAIDVDPSCLVVAAQNTKKHKVAVTLLESNLLTKYLGPADVLLCNLPYVPDGYQINQAARHEPRLAIFGGPDGLNLYRRLFSQLTAQPAYILAESLPSQHTELSKIAKSYSYKLAKTDHFVQLFKMDRI